MPLPDTCQWVATRDASRLHALTYQPPPAPDQINDDGRYFLIEAWSFSGPPLAFDPNGAVLNLHVRLSWPYRVPGSLVASPLASRE